MRSRPSLCSVLLLASSLAACDDAAPPTEPVRAGPKPDALVLGGEYSVTQLPLIPAGINDSGVIVGTFGTEVARYHNGVVTVARRGIDNGRPHVARGINNRGAMIGNVPLDRGLFWRAANQTPSYIISPSWNVLTPTALNDNNMVVGSYDHLDADGSYSTHAFRWTPSGGLQDITPPYYDFVSAVDVNDAGYVVGYGQKYGIRHTLRWPPNAGAYAVVLENAARVVAINDDGLAVGTASNSDGIWVWPLVGPPSRLAAPQSSSVSDISSLGRIVGFTGPFAPVNPQRAWTAYNGSTTWLPVPHAEYTQNIVNLRVNACGSIVGTQILDSGSRVGFLWTKRFLCDVPATATTATTTTASASP